MRFLKKLRERLWNRRVQLEAVGSVDNLTKNFRLKRLYLPDDESRYCCPGRGLRFADIYIALSSESLLLRI